MKKLSCIIGLLLLWFYAVPSQATIIVTSIEAKGMPSCSSNPYGNGCLKDFKLTWRRVSGPLDNELIPTRVTHYGIMHEHDNNGFSCRGVNSGLFPGIIVVDGCMPIPKGFTWKMVEELWLETYGTTGPGAISHSGGGDAVSRECVIVTGSNGSGYESSFVNNGPLVCVGTPPTPDPQCVTEGNPVFNFEIAFGQDTSGMQQEKTINLRCNIPANVTLMDVVGYNGRVELGWGYADVKVNGQALPVSLSASQSLPLRITATLHGIATKAGVAEGSFVIVVGYQ